MFGRSTASRFNVQKPDSTPGPGEYEIKNLKSTKKGAISKVERKFEYQKGSEYAHLGPGTYGSAKDASTLESKGVAGWAASDASHAVDHAAAMKRLAVSWHKIYGTEGSKKGEAHIKDREDVVAFLCKVVGDGSSTCSEMGSLKEEWDSIRARYADEVSAALKPGKQSLSSSASTGLTAAWKKVDPLGKASERAGEDMSKKMAKLSGLLSRLAEDIPSMVSVLGEPEREQQLMQEAEEASKRAEKAKEDLAEARALAEEESRLVRDALFEEKKEHAESIERCERLEKVIADGWVRLEALEARMVAGAQEQQAVIESLMAFPDTVATDPDDRMEEIAALAEELMQARRGESEAVEELGALRAAYLCEMKSSPVKKKGEDEALEQAQEAAEALESVVGEVHVYMELLEKSRKEARELRSEVSKERARFRRLQKTADALIAGEIAAGGGWEVDAHEAEDTLLGWAATDLQSEGTGDASLVEQLMVERDGLAALVKDAQREGEEAERALEEERIERIEFGTKAVEGMSALSEELEQAWSAWDEAACANAEIKTAATKESREAEGIQHDLSLRVAKLEEELSEATLRTEVLTKECKGHCEARSNLEGQLHRRESEGKRAVSECEVALCEVSNALVSLQQHAAFKWQTLETECQDLSQALRASTIKLEEGKREKESLEHRLAELSCEVTDLVDSQATLRGERDALVTQLASMTHERDSLSDDKTAILETLEGVASERDAQCAAKLTLESKRDDLAGELDSQSAALANVKDILIQTQAILEEKQRALAVAEGDVAGLKGLLEQQSDTVAALKGQFHEGAQALVVRIEEAETRTKECEEESTMMKTQIECVSSERDALSAQLATMITERGALKQDKDSLVGEKDALSLHLADTEKMRDAFKKEKESLEGVLITEEGKVSKLEGIVESLNDDKRGIEEMLMLAQEECKSKWELVVKLEAKMREGEEALEGEQNRVRGLKGEVGRLEGMVGDLETGMTSTEDRVMKLQDEVSRLKGSLNCAEEREETLKQEVRVVEERVEEGKKREEEGMERVQAAKVAQEEAETRCGQLETDLATGKQMAKAAKDEIIEAVAERDAVSASLSVVEESLKEVTGMLTQERQDKVAAGKIVEEYKENLVRVEGERDALAIENKRLESCKAKAEGEKIAAEESLKIASGASDALRRNIEALSGDKDALSQQLSQVSEEAQKRLDDAREEIERVRDAAASAHALHKEYRDEMQKLSASAQVSESLKAKLNLLEKDNQQLTNQNVHLVGHQNLKQKIHMHAKVKEENNKLKQDKAALERQVASQKAQLARYAAEEKSRVSKK